MKQRPEFITEDHLVYLDRLRETAITNMFGAAPYIQQAFGLDADSARQVLAYWMETFSERNPQ